MAHTCNPNYFGDKYEEDQFEASRGKQFMRPTFLEDNGLEWCRIPALQAGSPKCKPQTHQKKKGVILFLY
jgi:hypothetical protein